MAEKLVALLIVLIGIWNALNAKQAVRDHEEFQRYIRPKMRPYTETETRRSEILTTIVGVVFAVLGLAMLLDLLPTRGG